MELNLDGHHRHHPGFSVNPMCNPILILTSEPDSNPSHNRIFPVHLTKHLTLTLALFPGLTPHHHHQCPLRFNENLDLNLSLNITSEVNPKQNDKPILPVHITGHLTLNLTLFTGLYPLC